ncbi:dUTPase [Mycoplasma sp. E35C]|uniref:dUTPase n=1 Tax=Mycoplasma sp. E35C TaxID=2801918 RepID=UPI001CA4618C|nr:dUTPase [Mycoplasma sp. E35C]QZX49442.1 dUTPase [Mycoplasma sp. E35C]
MLIELKKLVTEQKELDNKIFKKTKSSYKKNQNQRRLWLLVEIGNLANHTKEFKFWKSAQVKDKIAILDAFAKVLHLTLSFLIQYEEEKKEDEVKYTYDLKPQKQQPSSLIISKRFLELYGLAKEMEDRWACETFTDKLITLFSLMQLEYKDLIKAYYKVHALILKRVEEDI